MEHLTVLTHRLGQILDHHVLHVKIPPKLRMVVFLVTHDLQQLAVVSHGFGQILHHGVLHKKLPPKVSCL